MSSIRNAALMSQITDYEGMVYGACRPTDIDLSMDFNKEVFIFVELKYAGSGLTIGQKIHLMGLVDGLEAGGREAYAILATHETPKGQSIMAKDALPVMVYSKGQWEMSKINTLHELIEGVKISYTVRKEEETKS